MMQESTQIYSKSACLSDCTGIYIYLQYCLDGRHDASPQMCHGVQHAKWHSEWGMMTRTAGVVSW